MGRPPGSRSVDYEHKRAALARQVFETIFHRGAASLNAMSDHAGVSRPTLRHYFGDRDGAVRAALELASGIGEPYLERLRTLPVEDASATLRQAVGEVVEGWRFGVGRLHEVGLKVGLEDATTGRTYLVEVLEPLLQAFEVVIGRLQRAGRLGPVDPRLGALLVLSPVVVALLHQDGLGGAEERPLDMAEVVAGAVGTFVAAHGVRRVE